MEAKLLFLLKKLDEHYHKAVDEFLDKQSKRRDEMKYKLKQVVVDEDDF
jgi:hypothetical protein